MDAERPRFGRKKPLSGRPAVKCPVSASPELDISPLFASGGKAEAEPEPRRGGSSYSMEDQTCHFDRSSASFRPSRPSRGRACIYAGPSASAIPPISIRSCFWTISGTTFRRTTWPGFPWHPHRGIETITYVLAGTVEHGDSLGNSGVITSGDVQWMTAGSGIIHQEMPKGDQKAGCTASSSGRTCPSSLKMTPPHYQEVKAGDVPSSRTTTGRRCGSSAGNSGGRRGPVDGIAADPLYLDVTIPPGKMKTLPIATYNNAFAYVFAGSGRFSNASGPLAVPTEAVRLARYRSSGRSGQSFACALRYRRRGERAGRGRRDPVSSGLGAAAGGAGGVVRSDRHEHPGTAPAGLPGAGERDVPENLSRQEAVTRPALRGGQELLRTGVVLLDLPANPLARLLWRDRRIAFRLLCRGGVVPQRPFHPSF